MHHQPVGLQGRHQGGGLLQRLRQGELREGNDAQGHGRCPDRGDITGDVLGLGFLAIVEGAELLSLAVLRSGEVEGHGSDTPRQEAQGFVHVRERKVAALQPAIAQKHHQRQVGEGHRPECRRLPFLLRLAAAQSATPPGQHGAHQQSTKSRSLGPVLHLPAVHDPRGAMRQRIVHGVDRQSTQRREGRGGASHLRAVRGMALAWRRNKCRPAKAANGKDQNGRQQN
mmetsp:Transcript_111841/g.266794  ORF Transcript_111841/g.266794 Transcript_111841/m.266794 type:complete len:227 (-) Transcript_111841:77-757(-)